MNVVSTLPGKNVRANMTIMFRVGRLTNFNCAYSIESSLGVEASRLLPEMVQLLWSSSLTLLF